MVALADALEASGHGRWQAYLGVAGAADAGCLVGFDERWPGDGRVTTATMDGSIGFAGHVVAAWLDRWEARGQRPEGPARVYACGPMVMLRAVQAAAEERGLPCEVSVETLMGCGMGACTGCAIENRRYEAGSSSPYDRWRLACKDGPVFEAGSVVLSGGGLH
jgi:dihydroorotate dehydrogenase electron transfer subunit